MVYTSRPRRHIMRDGVTFKDIYCLFKALFADYRVQRIARDRVVKRQRLHRY